MKKWAIYLAPIAVVMLIATAVLINEFYETNSDDRLSDSATGFNIKKIIGHASTEKWRSEEANINILITADENKLPKKEEIKKKSWWQKFKESFTSGEEEPPKEIVIFIDEKNKNIERKSEWKSHDWGKEEADINILITADRGLADKTKKQSPDDIVIFIDEGKKEKKKAEDEPEWNKLDWNWETEEGEKGLEWDWLWTREGEEFLDWVAEQPEAQEWHEEHEESLLDYSDIDWSAWDLGVEEWQCTEWKPGCNGKVSNIRAYERDENSMSFKISRECTCIVDECTTDKPMTSAYCIIGIPKGEEGLEGDFAKRFVGTVRPGFKTDDAYITIDGEKTFELGMKPMERGGSQMYTLQGHSKAGTVRMYTRYRMRPDNEWSKWSLEPNHPINLNGPVEGFYDTISNEFYFYFPSGENKGHTFVGHLKGDVASGTAGFGHAKYGHDVLWTARVVE